jgi:hypothetical protein
MDNDKLTCWVEVWAQDLDGALTHCVNGGYIYDDPTCDVETQITYRFLLFSKLDKVYLCEPLKYNIQAYLLYHYDDKKSSEENRERLQRNIKIRYARIFEAGNEKHKKFQLVIVKKDPDHMSTYETALDKVNTGNGYLVAPVDAIV